MPIKMSVQDNVDMLGTPFRILAIRDSFYESL